MKKRNKRICALVILGLVLAGASAETAAPAATSTAAEAAATATATPAPTVAAEASAALSPAATATPAPTPSPAPVEPLVGTAFVCADFTMTIPERFHALEGDDLALYLAAAQSDYGSDAQAPLVAADEAHTQAVSVVLYPSTVPAEDAAVAAAQALGAQDPFEENCGETRCWSLAFSLDDTDYRSAFLSDGARLLIVSCAGMPEDTVRSMLATLVFPAPAA